ncbi:MAG: ATP-binding protein [Ktedonobacteraceae bacterium]
MPNARGRRKRVGRWLLILAAVSLCVSLLVLDALNFFPQGGNMSPVNLARFGFSAFTALIYLAVGSLVWLFARQRHVARLLFCFSLAMMVTFANETASSLHNPLFTTATGISGVIALASFALLLLIFPYDYLAALRAKRHTSQGGRARYGRLFLGLYISAHLAFASLTIAYALAKNILLLALPTWLDMLVNLYYLVALACIILTITGAYCLSKDLRTRQQLLLFVVGVILACIPILLLTMLPLALNLPDPYVIDAQWSSLPLLLLPLALGYSILRYQILIFDRYIRRTVAWAVGFIGLALLCYLMVALSGRVFADPQMLLTQTISVTVSMALLGPATWWLARLATERVFFPEMRYYRQHVQRPEVLARETFDLNEAAELLLLAVMQAFETPEVCLYVLDEKTGYYHLAPALATYRTQGVMRGHLLWQLADFTKLFGKGNVEIVEAQHPVIQRLAMARRPLFLQEALAEETTVPVGLARYLVTAPDEQIDPLLVPVRAQGKLIGILCMGERGDSHAYAGPDLEALDLLLSHFSSILETARLYVQASRHVTVLNALYSASARLERAYLSIEEVVDAYANVVAEAMQAAAEIWIYLPERVILHRLVHAGQGPYMLEHEWISQLQEQDWSAWFQDGPGLSKSLMRSGQAPACLKPLAGTSYAWLPLCKGQRRLGVLLLSFPRPHVFSVEEKRILSMFARQCAAAMENAQITIALRAAYERQKDLDRLKDQFIMTASHELRTPLTAVQGYIELLNQYNDELSVEMRTEFIQKAYRGCDELALLVGNIMDASRLQIESERIRLAPVELAASVRHVMEILEAVTRRERRPVSLAVPPGLFIQADDLRLRQILLNLVSNALKYSLPETPIQLLALQGQGLVKISVRDYGLGVPREEQERLFERFVRLDRDMNSPVRGAGLGLYISKRLVAAMGGRLWVESSGVPGEGSTFSFTLQRAIAPRHMLSDPTLFVPQPG